MFSRTVPAATVARRTNSIWCTANATLAVSSETPRQRMRMGSHFNIFMATGSKLPSGWSSPRGHANAAYEPC